MKYSIVLGTVLAASTVLANPNPSPTRRRSPSRIGNSHHAIVAPDTNHRNVSEYAVGAQDYYNWSGAIQTANAGDVFTAVAATLTVPTPSVPSGMPAGTYSGAAWVGIDGADGTPSLFQAGADWSIDTSSGKPVYHYAVWYEWLPNYLIEVPNFPVKAGDVISVNVVSTSSSTGYAVIIDETSKQTTTISTSAPNPTATLQGKTVEWITEDLTVGSGLAPFANYHFEAFKGTTFRTKAGGYYNSASATLANLINKSGKVISQASRASSSEIDTTYVG